MEPDDTATPHIAGAIAGSCTSNITIAPEPSEVCVKALSRCLNCDTAAHLAQGIRTVRPELRPTPREDARVVVCSDNRA